MQHRGPVRPPFTYEMQKAYEILLEHFEQIKQNPINFTNSIAEINLPVARPIIERNIVTADDFVKGCEIITEGCEYFVNYYKNPPKNKTFSLQPIGNRESRRRAIVKGAKIEFFEALGHGAQKGSDFVEALDGFCEIGNAVITGEVEYTQLTKTTIKLASIGRSERIQKIKEVGEILLDLGNSIEKGEYEPSQLAYATGKLISLPARWYGTTAAQYAVLTFFGITNPWIAVPVSLGIALSSDHAFDWMEIKVGDTCLRLQEAFQPKKSYSFTYNNEQLARYLPVSIKNQLIKNVNNPLAIQYTEVTGSISNVINRIQDNYTVKPVVETKKETITTTPSMLSSNNQNRNILSDEEKKQNAQRLFQLNLDPKERVKNYNKISFHNYYKEPETNNNLFTPTDERVIFKYDTTKGLSGNIGEIIKAVYIIGSWTKREYYDKSKETRHLESIENKLQYYCSFNNSYDEDVILPQDDARKDLINECWNFYKTYPESTAKEEVRALIYHIENCAYYYEPMIPIFYLNGAINNSVNEARKEMFKNAQALEIVKTNYENFVFASEPQQLENLKILLSSFNQISSQQTLAFRIELINQLITKLPTENGAIRENPLTPILIEQLETVLQAKITDDDALFVNLFNLYSACGNKNKILHHYHQNKTQIENNIDASKVVQQVYAGMHDAKVTAVLHQTHVDLQKNTIMADQKTKLILQNILNNKSQHPSEQEFKNINNAEQQLSTIQKRQARLNAFAIDASITLANQLLDDNKYYRAGLTTYRAYEILVNKPSRHISNNRIAHGAFRLNQAIQLTFCADDFLNNGIIPDSWQDAFTNTFNHTYSAIGLPSLPKEWRNYLSEHWREDLEFASAGLSLGCTVYELFAPEGTADAASYELSSKAVAATCSAIKIGAHTSTIVDWTSRRFFPELQRHYYYHLAKEIPHTLLNDFKLIVHNPDATVYVAYSGYVVIAAAGLPALVVAGTLIGGGALYYSYWSLSDMLGRVNRNHLNGLMRAAYLAAKNGNSETATADFTTCAQKSLEMLAKNPNDATALHAQGSTSLYFATENLSRGYLDYNLLEKSEADFTKLLSHKKERNEAYDKLATIYFHRNQTSKIEEIISTIKIDKNASKDEKKLSHSLQEALDNKTKTHWKETKNQIIGEAIGIAVSATLQTLHKNHIQEKATHKFIDESLKDIGKELSSMPQRFWKMPAKNTSLFPEQKQNNLFKTKNEITFNNLLNFRKTR